MDELELERYALAKERISELLDEPTDLPKEYSDYFGSLFSFLMLLTDAYDRFEAKGVLNEDIDYLKKLNFELYRDIIPENYAFSYANPTYCVDKFGLKNGRILAALTAEMRSAIGFVFEGEGHSLLIRLELCLEVYCYFANVFEAGSENADENEGLEEILYWYVSDYCETQQLLRVAEMVDESRDFALKIINEDLSNTDYLYRYGEYITENEIKLAAYINSLPEYKIKKMADTFTEGYRIGFVNTGKDLSIKSTVNIRYPLGMERVIKAATENFEKMGLKSVIYRAYAGMFRGGYTQRVGYYGANPNPQYGYDHSKDSALFLDGQIVTRKLECLEAAFEQYKDKAAKHAGPAVMEIFGEKPFTPESKEVLPVLSDKQQVLTVRYASASGTITNKYIKGEERSFTIIAFPSPEIGKDFEAIFDETLEINTLDYYEYQKMQQRIIECLDKADSVHIKGKCPNKTDLMIKLCDIKDASKQTKFENCVADVNIPVGEVFTSPKLKGTNGILNVSEVYLNELKYTDLTVRLEDGMVADYMCSNYTDEKKNRDFFKENVLFNHESLPIGEFAIGTNTRAYAMGRKYDIQGRLPILIAEKTGPHFALGDTCYSHAEDIAVYNPDGKEIIARDNEVSILRKSDISKSYFNCHTDITIPYDEIEILETVSSDDERVPIIREGRFVLEGLEELNKYL